MIFDAFLKFHDGEHVDVFFEYYGDVYYLLEKLYILFFCIILHRSEEILKQSHFALENRPSWTFWAYSGHKNPF